MKINFLRSDMLWIWNQKKKKRKKIQSTGIKYRSIGLKVFSQFIITLQF